VASFDAANGFMREWKSMLNIRTLCVVILGIGLTASWSGLAFAQPSDPHPAEAAHTGEADLPFDQSLLPFAARDVAAILIYLGGIIAALVFGTRLQGFPSAFFAIGFACMAIDPIADLVVFHLLKDGQFQSPNVTYAGASILSSMLGVAFLILGVQRVSDLLRRPGS